MKTCLRLAVVCLLLASLTLSALAAPPVLRPNLANLQLGRLAPQRLALYLGQKLTIEGFYYDGSVPLLVDDYNRVRMNVPMPPDSYKLLVGQIPAGLKSGQQITLRVLVRKPLDTDPLYTRLEPALLEALPAEEGQTVTPVALLPRAVMAIDMARIRDLIGRLGPLLLAKRYAVLIVGGISPGNNHVRYWNELKNTYALLKAAGYTDANIYVLYANGTARDDSVTVDYSATRANLTTVFNDLAAKMKDSDTLYLMTNDHGGGFLRAPVDAAHPAGFYGGVLDTNGEETDNLSEAFYNRDLNADGDKTDTVSVDETLCLWGENITDDQFAAEVNKLTHYSRMAIQMEQCFSGGFLRDLLGPNRLIMSACNEAQFSWAYADNTGNYNYNAFTFHYLAALNASNPDGSGAVNADTTGDGATSLREAYVYARSHDGAAEEPWYNDIGVMPPVHVPGAGNAQGALGALCFIPL